MFKTKNNFLKNFLLSLESISDSFIQKFYNETLISEIQKIEFIKKLLKSNFIQSLQNFGKSWFKDAFVSLGYIRIFVWILWGFVSLISFFQNLTVAFSSIIFSLLNVLLMFFTIIMWVWIVKFKKWLPFWYIITAFLNLIYIIFKFILFSTFWYLGFIINLAFFFFLVVIILVLLLKNKNLFVN